MEPYLYPSHAFSRHVEQEIFTTEIKPNLSKNSKILFVIHKYMFRPISGHLHFYSWSLKHMEKKCAIRASVKPS